MSDQTHSETEGLYTVVGLCSLTLGLFLLAVFARTLSGGAPPFLVLRLVSAFFFLSVAVATFPPLRDLWARRRSLGTFGRVRRVDRRVVDDPDHGQPCVVCGETVTEGVERRYRDELFVAGIPVATDTVGYNSYCLACADETDDDPEHTAPSTADDSQTEWA